MKITLPESAVKTLKDILQDNQDRPQTIRVYFAGIGWGGPSFGIALDEQKDSDVAYEVEGLQFIVRKSAHFLAYAILGGLCFESLSTLDKLSKKKTFFIALLISVLYAISDEIHQYFVPGRACQFRDVMIDSCGALFGIAVIVILKKIAYKIKIMYNDNKKQIKLYRIRKCKRFFRKNERG